MNLFVRGFPLYILIVSYLELFVKRFFDFFWWERWVPTPLPSKGTVLQTAEFADSLYSPLFVSSLYHILIDLSRVFLDFFWCRGSESNRHSLLPQQVFYHFELPRHRIGFCILRILDIVSACEVWFTLIFRKQEHLAVGSWGRGLIDSRGSFPLGLPYPRLLYPYCITL